MLCYNSSGSRNSPDCKVETSMFGNLFDSALELAKDVASVPVAVAQVAVDTARVAVAPVAAVASEGAAVIKKEVDDTVAFIKGEEK